MVHFSKWIKELHKTNGKKRIKLGKLQNEQIDKSVSDIDGDTWYQYFYNLGLVSNNIKSGLDFTR